MTSAPGNKSPDNKAPEPDRPNVATPTRPPRRVKRRRLTTRRVLLLLILALAIAAVIAQFLPTRRPVRTNGFLMTGEEVELRPSVQGAIHVCHVSNGQHVDQGQVVIELDSRIPRASLEEARSALAAKRAQLSRLLTSQDIERQRRKELVAQAIRQRDLLKSQLDALIEARGGYSKRELDEATLRLEEATSRVAELEINRDELMENQQEVLRLEIEAAQKKMMSLEAQINQHQITAPITGKVWLHRFAPGEVVKPEHVLGQVFNADRWVVKLKTPERYLRLIKEGQPVTVTLSGYPVRKYGVARGTITSIMPLITPQATGDGIFYAEATVDQFADGMEPWPGMTADVVVDTGETTWLKRVTRW